LIFLNVYNIICHSSKGASVLKLLFKIILIITIMASVACIDSDDSVASKRAKPAEKSNWKSSYRFDAIFLAGTMPQAGEAITQAKSTVPEKISESLHNLKRYEGLTGAYTFDKNGDVSGKAVVIKVVKEGKFELVI